MAYDPEKFRSNPNKFLQDELTNLGLATTKDIKLTNVSPPVNVVSNKKPLQDTYGYGVNTKKLNKLINKVSGRGLAKLN